MDLRCLGQVQYGIGLGLVGIHILAQLGAVVFHRAVRNLDDEGAVARITVIFIRADAAAVCQRGIIGHRTAGDVQGLGGGGVGHVEIVVVVLVALFRLLIARHVDTAAIVGRIAGDFAIGQVDTAFAVFIILAIGIQAAAVGFGRVFGDGGFGHIQRGQLTRVDTACHTETGVLGNVAVLQVDRQAVAFMAANPQTASAAALIIGDFAAGKGRFHLLLLAFANRCQRASQAYSTVLAFVVGDLAVFHRKELLVHIERTYVIVTCAAGIVGQDTVAPGSACLYAVTGIVIPIVLVQVRNVHRRIQTVGVVLNGHVIKRAVGRHIIRIVLVVAAAQHADDTALALGVGKAGVGNFQIVAVMDKQYGIISAVAADGVVVKHSVGNLGTVAEIIGIRDINSISRGHVVDDAAVVDKDLTLCLTAAGVANINSRSRTAISCNVVIKQHVAHMLGAAAAYLQGCAAAVIVAVASGVADELGVVAAFRQGNVLLIANGVQVTAHVHATAAVIGLVFLKQVARAQGQGAIILVDSAASVGAAAVIFESTPVNQIGHINVARVYTYRAARTVGGVVFKGVVLQHYVIRTILFAFSLFRIDAGLHVDCTAAVASAVACKGVAA